MRWLTDTKGSDRCKALIYKGVNTHKWASKMEIHRLIGGRPELRLKAGRKGAG
ncbi:MAG: hypothetical protein ACYTEQ_21295 [Planctomycetota bacterium]|jgi:hypothetical protein